jgi:hypothetical protein
MGKMKIERFKIIVLFVLLVATITSCAVAALSSEPMFFQIGNAKSGLIIGSITFPKEKAKFNSYFIRIKGIDGDEKTARKKSTEIQISPEQIWKMKHAGQIENGLTYLFAI